MGEVCVWLGNMCVRVGSGMGGDGRYCTCSWADMARMEVCVAG